ncbi:hypothetical protein [Tropicibacter sp. Alg240-R139]|uniref:hypothetical protein n=1 Tax=Tropicibacter sp. Alg240-R139 TaxID=2305991 RepID=UPI0013E0048A|nr:hypothetical protein [Tropicibacter sp. Alg240-R139]
MRRFALILAVLAGATAVNANEKPEDARVLDALMGKKLDYGEGAWQEFRPSMKTLYHSGRPSWGYWAVRDGQYCSQWPPSSLWACYDIELTEDGVRFVGERGDITTGSYTD